MASAKPRTQWDPRSEMAAQAVEAMDAEHVVVGLCVRCWRESTAAEVVIVDPGHCEDTDHGR